MVETIDIAINGLLTNFVVTFAVPVMAIGLMIKAMKSKDLV